MSEVGPGCVKTSTSRERAELFSLFAFFDGARQRCSFLIQLIRGKRSTRKSDFGVFTQPGSLADLTVANPNFRLPPGSRHRQLEQPCPESAKFGSRPSLDDEGFFAKQSCRKFKADDGPSARPKLTASALLGCAVCWTLKSH
jgi:hypothetical protein